jgi:LppP/LprE lipoprotein
MTWIALLVAAVIGQAGPPASWLDKPLAGWNDPGAAIPRAPTTQGGESSAALAKRCQFTGDRSTPAARALAEAGWIPFPHFDQKLAQDGVEIMDGLTAADGMCRPRGYNVFVFVDGRFAGTLSPAAMNSREDGTAGAVRILSGTTLTAEFARYTDKDALCCPSARVTVTFTIDRSAGGAVVKPVSVKTTREL